MSKKIKFLEQFLAEQKIEEGLFDVVTKSKAFIKNPISATKITNNGKKLAQAEIDSAATELDYEKRKLAASKEAKQKIELLTKKGDKEGIQKVKDDVTDSKDVLKAAHDQKEEALKDTVSSVKDRIDDLSKKNSSLQDLASLVKTAARVKKNEVLLKGADEEEKKQLKLQIKQDTEKIQGLQKGFGEYEGSKDKDEEPKTEPKKEPKDEPKKEPKDEPKVEPKTEPKKEPNTSEPTELLTKTSNSTESKEEKIASLEKDIEESNAKIKNWKNGISQKKTQMGSVDSKKQEILRSEIDALEKKIKDATEGLAIDQQNLEELRGKETTSSKETPKESFTGLKSFKDFVRG